MEIDKNNLQIETATGFRACNEH